MQNSGQFKKGQSGNPKGREKGSKNKFTSIKQTFVDAFAELENTDGETLVDWIRERKPNKAQFLQMVSKMLPTKSDSEFTGTIRHTLKIEEEEKGNGSGN